MCVSEARLREGYRGDILETVANIAIYSHAVPAFDVTCTQLQTKWQLSSLGMFCKLPRTASSACLSLLPASPHRHLLSLSLKGVAKRTVTDLTGKTQAVLPLSTVKRFLEANKLPYKEGHAALTLNCPLCERDTSQTVFINKTTGGLVCPPCKVHGEPIRLGPSGAVSEYDSNV